MFFGAANLGYLVMQMTEGKKVAAFVCITKLYGVTPKIVNKANVEKGRICFYSAFMLMPSHTDSSSHGFLAENPVDWPSGDHAAFICFLFILLSVAFI